MELDKIIDSSILDIFPLMPSSGAWPFTMVRIDRNELPELGLQQRLFASSQLLVLKRTDFNEENLIDYALHSKEYSTLLPTHRLDFLEVYRKKTKNRQELNEWTELITGLAIGLIIQITLKKGLQFSPIEISLSALDVHFGLSAESLSAYQLFDVYQIDPSSMR